MKDNRTKTVSIGAKGYSDYTKHKDPDRKERYIDRHKKNENWRKSGINIAGFYSRWLLWNKPTLTQSARDLNNEKEGVRFKIAREFVV